MNLFLVSCNFTFTSSSFANKRSHFVASSSSEPPNQAFLSLTLYTCVSAILQHDFSTHEHINSKDKMPPKKEAPAADSGIAGYDLKETKLLAAAFLSSIGPDKVCPLYPIAWRANYSEALTDCQQYDYPLFAKLSGFTEGTLKKFWPPVKKKGIENHENFGKFLGGGSVAPANAPKAAAGKKRKAADDDAGADPEPSDAADVNDGKTSGKPAKAPAKGKGRGKKVKTEEKVKEEDDSADGGDGLSEFVFSENVVNWLESADRFAEGV
ncbi:hypothetical protein EKO04_006501 [Ascochyta lentis]|uniref:Uncharacterized protein n=1 Tax=Ascochyta lentis TaxID=205686 RepID=A0A8H7J5C4_9PLEO|nr:hypothetical protein EKO04_006501 [Ascochyta lentis]